MHQCHQQGVQLGAAIPQEDTIEVFDADTYHLEKVDTKMHKGDFFTKHLSIPTFREALIRMGIHRV